jgi:hypothetical protein
VIILVQYLSKTSYQTFGSTLLSAQRVPELFLTYTSINDQLQQNMGVESAKLFPGH